MDMVAVVNRGQVDNKDVQEGASIDGEETVDGDGRQPIFAVSRGSTWRQTQFSLISSVLHSSLLPP